MVDRLTFNDTIIETGTESNASKPCSRNRNAISLHTFPHSASARRVLPTG